MPAYRMNHKKIFDSHIRSCIYSLLESLFLCLHRVSMPDYDLRLTSHITLLHYYMAYIAVFFAFAKFKQDRRTVVALITVNTTAVQNE